MFLFLIYFQSFIGDIVYGALEDLLWYIAIQGPLLLINSFEPVITLLNGGLINSILFKNSKAFSFSDVPEQFWWFLVVSVIIFSIFFTIQMLILQFKESMEMKKKLFISINNSVKAFTFTILIPLFFYIANFCLTSLSNAMTASFSKGGSLAQYLWHVGDTSWDGKTISNISKNFGPPSSYDNYNLWGELFAVWFVFCVIILTGILLVQKVIELFFLFLISPIVMTTMVLDEGKRAFIWKDLVIAKFLASSSTTLGLYMFMGVISIVISTDYPGIASGGPKNLFIILVIAGSGLASYNFSNLVSGLVGESAGLREGLNSINNTMGGPFGIFNSGRKMFSLPFKAASKAYSGGSSFIKKIKNSKSNNNNIDNNTNNNHNNFRLNNTNNINRENQGIRGLSGFNNNENLRQNNNNESEV